MHGGSAPQVVAAARRRLLEAADPAAARLVELMASDDERIGLRAARDILDRAGLAAHARVEIPEQDDLPPFEQVEAWAEQWIVRLSGAAS